MLFILCIFHNCLDDGWFFIVFYFFQELFHVMSNHISSLSFFAHVSHILYKLYQYAFSTISMRFQSPSDGSPRLKFCFSQVVDVVAFSFHLSLYFITIAFLFYFWPFLTFQSNALRMCNFFMCYSIAHINFQPFIVFAHVSHHAFALFQMYFWALSQLSMAASDGSPRLDFLLSTG